MSELILNCNNVSFDSFICQTAIQTEEDKKLLQSQNYPFVFTETEFRSFLDGVDPRNIYYIPSLSVSAIYFNKATLAACPCHIELMWMSHQRGQDKINKFVQAIAANEERAANMDFMMSVYAIPDGARSEYFNMLLDKYPEGGKVIPNLFSIFFSAYENSDFGCHKIKKEVMQKIVASRCPEDETKLVETLKEYPDVLTIYRGGSYDISTPTDLAYSWTLDINVANFFASRLGYSRGYIATATAPKSKVIYFESDGNEQEVVVAPGDVSICDTIELKGLTDCEEIISQIAEKYNEYMDMLDELDFSQEPTVHGRAHAARVLLLALTISYYLGLSDEDLDVLGMAAIYHDTCRENDKEDAEHGHDAMLYYQCSSDLVDPLVEFLIEYHCRPDKDGYWRIRADQQLSKEAYRAELLFNIFKDADALDRVRFGLRNLDMNQLRLPISKTLPIVANIYLRQIKVD